MTLRNLIDLGILEGDPVGAWLIALRILRSLEQREAATIEGVAASAEAWFEIYGAPVTEAKLKQWLTNLGRLADIRLSDSVLRGIIRVVEAENTEES